MPYVPIPKDLGKVKNKIVFNLTKRQLLCFGIAAGVGIPFYLLTRNTLGSTGGAFVMIALVLPCFAFALYEKNGLPLEKVIRNIVYAKFLNKPIRTYRTNNFYSVLDKQASLIKEVQEIERKAGENNPHKENSRKKEKDNRKNRKSKR